MSGKYQQCVIESLDDLLDLVRKIPLQDQKDLLQDIYQRFEEDGWEVEYYGGYLKVKRVEFL